jgi:hypothetical protein
LFSRVIDHLSIFLRAQHEADGEQPVVTLCCRQKTTFLSPTTRRASFVRRYRLPCHLSGVLIAFDAFVFHPRRRVCHPLENLLSDRKSDTSTYFVAVIIPCHC